MMRSSHILLLILVGCVHEPDATSVRFANAPIARIVNDRVDVGRPPHGQTAMLDYHAYQSTFARPISRALELPRHRRAQGVNAIDDVPDSTWFTHRRGLTLEQMRAGPVTIDTPERHLPWTIESTSYGGSSMGFVIRDARGIKYQLKFDTTDLPEAETAADAIADRLIWACGYNVPEDQVVYVDRAQLQLSPKAVVKGASGKAIHRLTRIEVDEMLDKVAQGPGSHIRGIASRWLAGTSLGPTKGEGVRSDDPNDQIPHELRRDQRGLQVIYAWLDMVDVIPGNTLDVWTEDPGDPSHHYVKHYLLDFGSSLGVLGTKARDRRSGQAYRVDWKDILRSFFTAGLVTAPRGDRGNVDIPGVAPLFEAKAFDPAKWKAEFTYLPFQEMDEYDGFWAAKIVARLTPSQIRAAVESARFTDPRAVDYITDTLVARQRKTAAYWFHRVNPLDAFEVDDRLCFDDLAIAHGFEAATSTRYSISGRDRFGRKVGTAMSAVAERDGHTCVAVPPLAGQADRYTVLQVSTTRPDFQGSTYVHVARDAAGALRVIGVWRE
jgi:hypothetical protein